MQAVADDITLGLVTTSSQAIVKFDALWLPVQQRTELTYTTRASWKLLLDRGRVLAALMAQELPLRIPVGEVRKAHLNERLQFLVGDPPVEMLGFPDLYGPVQAWDGERGQWATAILDSILDYKTSDREYNPDGVELDEQLWIYQLGEEALGRPVAQVGLCVLIYAAQPRIQWLLEPARPPEELARVAAGIVLADRHIRAGEFSRNLGSCYTMGECAFTPLCYPRQRGRVATELTQRETQAPEALDLGEDV